jgi:hypothetical protein
MKSINKAILEMVSESLGCNESECTGDPEKPGPRGRARGRRAGALVKKVVFDELQFFARNSTVESGMCGKPKKDFELVRPAGICRIARECG